MKKSLAALLAFTVACSLCIGCQQKDTAPSETGPKISSKAADNSDSSTTKETKKESTAATGADLTAEPEAYNGPMGRYVDQLIPFPDEIKALNLDFISPNPYPKDSLLDACSYTNDCSKFYRFRLRDDMTWTSEEMKWAVDAMPHDGHSWAEGITIGKDGKGYFIYYSNDGSLGHVIRQVDDTSWEELDIPYLRKADSSGRKPHPQLIEVDTNGDLYLGDFSEFALIDGKTLKEITTYSPSTEVNSMCLTDDFLYIISGKESCIYEYEKKDHALKNTMKYDSINPYSAKLCNDDSGALYLLDQEGLFSLQKGNSTWEMIMDGSLGSLCDPENQPAAVCLGKNSDFYFWANSKAYHISYNDSVPTQPDKNLSVYALYNTDEIHKAASLFQMNHPDYKVDLKIASDANLEWQREQVDVSDFIKALNTELLAGNGCDVLILDGLPFESYTEKHILENLYDYVPSLKDSSSYQFTLIKNSEIDGSLYYIPAFFGYYGIQGTDDLVNPAVSIHSILEYIQSSGNKQYFGAWPQDMFTSFILNLEADRLFTKAGFLSQDEMITLFQDIRSIQSVTDNGLELEALKDESANIALMDRMLKDNKTLAFSKLAGTSDNMELGYIDAHRDGTIHPLTNECIPRTLAGINHSSSHKEAAGLFIDYLLSPDVQNYALFSNGICIRLSGLNQLRTCHNDNFCTGFGNYIFGVPENEQNEKIADAAMTLSKIRPGSKTLYNIYYETITNFLKSSADPESTASELYNRIKLAMEE